MSQACLRPRDRFWDIPVPKIDSAFDNLLVPQPSWSPNNYATTSQARCCSVLGSHMTGHRVRRPTLFSLWRKARRVKQCGLAATGDYQPSLRSPWLAARARMASSCKSKTWEPS
ncbi:hypothetical protein, partial [Thiolapillus sp.]|uniref:hypothetical protein n=1 Tax=Thiolapillus sp. TaxID=2017437 RepID=UPI003AF675D0